MLEQTSRFILFIKDWGNVTLLDSLIVLESFKRSAAINCDFSAVPILLSIQFVIVECLYQIGH